MEPTTTNFKAGGKFFLFANSSNRWHHFRFTLNYAILPLASKFRCFLDAASAIQIPSFQLTFPYASTVHFPSHNILL